MPRPMRFIGLCGSSLKAPSTIFFNSRKDRAAHWAESMENLERFETELRQLSLRQTTYFGGEDLPGWMDYMIWPWFERINIFPSVFKVTQ